jgi:ribosomal-protein-alanine N-acetyltransferase
VTLRIDLRHPKLGDQGEFLAAVGVSRALHHPWITAPSTPFQFRAYVRGVRLASNCSFLVCRSDTGSIAGVINVSNIVFGLFRSGYLGYYAFSGHERQGFMRDGLKAVLRHAFDSLKLHRLEANIQPDNFPSIALARSCGFAREGFSPRYLKIGGRWRDHERWAILAS